MKLKTILVAALIAATTVLVPSATASANSTTIHPATTCGSGWLCLYTDANYGGNEIDFYQLSGCVNLTGPFNNSISSLHNYTTRTQTIHWSVCNDTLTHWSFNSGGSAANLNALPFWPYWNDATSSVSG